MTSNPRPTLPPWQLALRFALEVGALVAIAAWARTLAAGAPGIALAALVSASVAAAWGIFAVPDDPSRSGSAPVPVPGIVRLLLELAVFAAAAAALVARSHWRWLAPFAVSVVVHHVGTTRRLAWLLRHRRA